MRNNHEQDFFQRRDAEDAEQRRAVPGYPVFLRDRKYFPFSANLCVLRVSALAKPTLFQTLMNPLVKKEIRLLLPGFLIGVALTFGNFFLGGRPDWIQVR